MSAGEDTVEVVYVPVSGPVVRTVAHHRGMTVREAVERSGIAAAHPGVDLERDGVGIFGVRVELDAAVAAGDRVEIYRPLRVDPKEARRLRAARRRAR